VVRAAAGLDHDRRGARHRDRVESRIRARGFFRGIFFFPVMLSPVVVAMTWVWLLQRDGALNGISPRREFPR
jgi:ABC-type sugar transport system permease subunit